MYYQVNPYKVARFQNALMRKVASDPGLAYGLQKEAGKLDGLVKLLGKGLKGVKGAFSRGGKGAGGMVQEELPGFAEAMAPKAEKVFTDFAGKQPNLPGFQKEMLKARVKDFLDTGKKGINYLGKHPFGTAASAAAIGGGIGYDIGHAVGDDGISSADVINSAGAANAAGYAAGAADTKERIKGKLYEYLPYVGGGAALASIVGGVIGNAAGNTLAGSLIGAGTGAAAGAVGKGLYDKYIG